MKRLWIGVGLLAFFLILGILLTLSFARIHGPLEAGLRQAEALARAENWEQTRAVLKDTRAQWQKMRNFVAAFADHEPLEELDSCLDQLQVLAELEDGVEFGAACARAAALADAMGDSQQVTWWNLL